MIPRIDALMLAGLVVGIPIGWHLMGLLLRWRARRS